MRRGGKRQSPTQTTNPPKSKLIIKIKKITVQTARAPPARIAALARVPLAMRRGGKRQPPTQTTNPPKITVQTARAPPASIAALARVPLAMRRGGKRQSPTQTTNTPKITAHHSNQKITVQTARAPPASIAALARVPLAMRRGGNRQPPTQTTNTPKSHSPSFKSKNHSSDEEDSRPHCPSDISPASGGNLDCAAHAGGGDRLTFATRKTSLGSRS